MTTNQKPPSTKTRLATLARKTRLEGQTALLLGVFIALIIFFAYFYTAVTFNTSDVADNMKKFGGFIPGIRPGTHIGLPVVIND